MNLGYGIKNYVLKEEAALPSVGYNDVVQRMINIGGKDLLPWNKQGLPLDVRTRDEMTRIILGATSVKEAIANLVKDKIAYNRGTLMIEVPEENIYRDVQAIAIKNIETIISNYSHKALNWMAQAMRIIFTSVYKQIVVNEEALKSIRKLCNERKGPIIFCPTHRSYVDFLLVSAVLYYYNMEVPHICAGEDLMMIKGVSHLLRMSGAFFMRRTFRGDPLYKAIFTTYVEQLCKDKMIMEFFVEGTRSRTNKMLAPKFGILQIVNSCFFDKKVEEVTFVPVTINYTRTLEGESFPNELTGENKVKESLSRIVKAFSILAMNFGTIYLDFYEPIKLSSIVA
jgi:glycerol-3-phosphate O-acyltransferase